MTPKVSLREALSDRALLGKVLAGETWKPWRVLLIASMGEALIDAHERAIFKQFTGRDHAPGRRVNEMAIVAGRRGGKTRALALLATYIAALCDHSDALAPGERGIVLCVAQGTDIAKKILTRDAMAAARTLGLQLHILQARSEREFASVFATLTRLRAGALVIGSDVLFTNGSKQLATLALRHAVPTIYATRAIYAPREFAESGGLISCGPSIADAHRLAGTYVGRILKGEKPADLPVQQVTKIELVINLKTAKALGLTVPGTLLARADEVIE